MPRNSILARSVRSLITTLTLFGASTQTNAESDCWIGIAWSNANPDWPGIDFGTLSFGTRVPGTFPTPAAALDAAMPRLLDWNLGKTCYVFNYSTWRPEEWTTTTYVVRADQRLTSNRIVDYGSRDAGGRFLDVRVEAEWWRPVDFLTAEGKMCRWREWRPEEIPPGPPGPGGVAFAADGILNRIPECQAPHTIRLSNDTGAFGINGALADVEPGRVTGTLRAKVYDANNQLVSHVPLRIEVEVIANSGGHRHHDDRRPKGLLSIGFAGQTAVEWNSGFFGMPFRFLAPEVSGDHKIKATCLDRPCTQEGADTIWVGIKGLQPIPASPNYVLIPNADTTHPDNHYLTPVASATIRTIANVYRSRFPGDPVLHLNDASLERGGLFDNLYVGRSGSGWWKPPHDTHRKGTDIDIRANPQRHPTTSIPEENFAVFIEILRNLGGDTIPPGRPAYEGTANQHFHVTLRETRPAPIDTPAPPQPDPPPPPPTGPDV